MTPTEALLEALHDWLEACAARVELALPLRRYPLRRATDRLCAAIGAAAPGSVAGELIASCARGVTAALEADRLGDDAAEAPADVEWDVHNLVAAIDPSHAVPDDVEPAGVTGTIFFRERLS